MYVCPVCGRSFPRFGMFLKHLGGYNNERCAECSTHPETYRLHVEFLFMLRWFADIEIDGLDLSKHRIKYEKIEVMKHYLTIYQFFHCIFR